MCGIAGYFVPRGEAEVSLLRRMNDRIVHRGPDEDGYWTGNGCGLGMRRLSIIDLAGGRQPIPNEDESAWIVFNGEIYNYRELRRELEGRGHRFRTASDTEVILHLWEDEGEGALEKLRGMFGLAIWDERRQRLLLARDRFGKKPLHYAQHEGRLYFASELKSFRGLGLPLEVDRDALRLYLRYRYVPEPRSIFQRVRKVPAAGWITYDAAGQWREGRYWQLPPQQVEDEGKLERAEAREQLRCLFDESVRLRMVADVPLGAFLSAGGGFRFPWWRQWPGTARSRYVRSPLDSVAAGRQTKPRVRRGWPVNMAVSIMNLK
ncbi:asparagine synthase (glutamine-hydrolyzing) [Oscillatoria amoena NRMC-F 0135]|nr:asparagine synthase (glutamine-hydrolyzing) [Oscillatoria amoena NRMC-F 0135]